jgi:hypothetical protein
MTINSPNPVSAMTEYAGHPEVHDIADLVGWLMATPGTYIFGGLVRHIINPAVHAEFGDIDLIALTTATMTALGTMFGYLFREVSRPGQFPRYFLAKSPFLPKPIQLILMRSHAEAMQFAVDGPQYDIDRVAYSDGRFYFDQTIGEAAIRHAINVKRASQVKGPRDLRHFAKHRPQIEQRHRLKLIRKGFAIIDQTSTISTQKDFLKCVPPST